MDQLQELQKSKPMSSKFFRARTIEKILNNHFVKCWEYEKSQSPKLSFYHLNKHKFAREAYLNDTKGFSRRYNTTQLKISAHDLEIERGRYTNAPRDERICTWCNTSMGATIIEVKSHMLYECDLYEDIRAKLITRLNRSPPIQNTHPNNPELTLFIDQQALKTDLMNMLSPYTTSNIDDNPADSYNIYHKPLSIKPTALIEQKLNYRRSYIVNIEFSQIYLLFVDNLKVVVQNYVLKLFYNIVRPNSQN